MISADSFIDTAISNGFSFFSGVPCSYLSPLINRVISRRDANYVGATSEGEAVAIAAGAWLAGRQTVVMCQNSGLGNAVNPLTSLNYPFRIPTLLVVTWRGKPGEADEPQHVLMGRITKELLAVIDVPSDEFPALEANIGPALQNARNRMATSSLPFAMIMSRDAVANSALDEVSIIERGVSGPNTNLTIGGHRPSRHAVLERLLTTIPNDVAVVATTGKCGRELFTLEDRKQHIYQVGSMGAASAMALGIALTTQRRVIVIDGDGAALMKLGNLATIGARRPANYIHLLLDNGVHDSTGGQATVSPSVDFAAVAISCGYCSAWTCDDLEGLETAVANAFRSVGPTMIHMRIAPGSMKNLGRPTLSPAEVALRFKAFLQER
ncbi:MULTISPECIES: phosphonopyruvate decarboxylase [Rhizobium/Agrobacterium group]|uniref:Phosphonopyruvate decarboxylase protein n=2 Tax=Rhizobium/Agrobacterium group TaxID=227290 RepID=B9JZY7_ALLAM|nr:MULTISPECIES: phosphonopyruvate decarboxylase [Rhizobium/Agrobacterium group]ACM37446.1 phosphonopyruvate decarboxylase protein [Allorhizobium ampelinum S4]MCF1450579.1 phosphonopyruvate decarboxylase [Allorhizobium ampelinum]MCF1463510.1 phosphonopyruvate decarboxylase [Allorhizobium ampelinum]MCF1470752.1 phosphonopyruvate decarboxylase [Allorhizobium ampelinum]MCF1496174.1 phosphonopyruvate decarboxylase [Allorhizobium ampelinum]